MIMVAITETTMATHLRRLVEPAITETRVYNNHLVTSGKSLLQQFMMLLCRQSYESFLLRLQFSVLFVHMIILGLNVSTFYNFYSTLFVSLFTVYFAFFSMATPVLVKVFQNKLWFNFHYILLRTTHAFQIWQLLYCFTVHHMCFQHFTTWTARHAKLTLHFII